MDDKDNFDFIELDGREDEDFSLITEFRDIDETTSLTAQVNLDNIAILPLRNTVLFPTAILPVGIGRESSLRLVKEAFEKKNYIGVFCQKNENIENPTFEDLYDYGVLAKIVRVFNMNDNKTTAILQGFHRVRLTHLDTSGKYPQGKIEKVIELLPKPDDKEFAVIMDNCREKALKLFTLYTNSQGDAEFALKNMKDNNLLLYFLCTNINANIDKKIDLLKIDELKEKAYQVLTHIKEEISLSELQQKIHKRTTQELNKQQKEYFLQHHLKNIQEELGINVNDQDSTILKNKAKDKKWSKEVGEIFNKEIAKLERIPAQTPDYHVQLNYLQLFVSLPWGECTTDNLDIKNARKILDKDHYGLEKVKERIIEHLAVLKMRGDLKSPIICLYGPPGVGKTSLGRSIAEALNRKYVRVSLGGLHDESEIRGHRKTYIGAMPGRILKNLAKAGSDNPVFILDEIDKVGQASNHGDPSSALLEVLDPEQNSTFHDNFLDVDYDLSNVLFIATANNLSNIPSALLDRMELIEVSGYLTEEKIEIAKRHLLPKEKEANGIAKEKVTINKAAIEQIIEDYTRESGVRGLEKKISKIFRRLACQKASKGEFDITTVKPQNLVELLGPKEFTRDRYQGNEYAGVVVGLAWTAAGGEILFIETSLSRGKGEKITLTGNLGDVMKESAILALEYIKSHSDSLGIPYEVFDKWNIHLHVPEGAIPKDGPSAGITMTTALVSALTQRKVKPNIAMTGEITLRGKVLPVGGIKEKILAAKRAGIKEIILCKENRRNIEAIPEIYLKGLTFHYVDEINEVLEIALLKEKVKKPINLI